MAFFRSATNKRNRTMRKAAMYKPLITGYNDVGLPIYTTKKQQEAKELGFLGYSLKYGNIMLLGDISSFIEEYRGAETNLVSNHIFDNIQADKIGIIYSPKKKMYMMLALNDNYMLYILFQSPNLYDLPNVDKLDLENLPTDISIVENINRIIVMTYQYIYDMTSNPVLPYNITEVFRK